MTEFDRLRPAERAKQYRTLAKDAKRQARQSTGEIQDTFNKFAAQWERLALDAEAGKEWGWLEG